MAGGKLREIPELTPKEGLRFRKFYTKQGKNDCWEWKGAVNEKGYGVFSLRGTNYLSHRLTYTMKIQKQIPEGFVVIQSCGNRKCVNTEHLNAVPLSGNRSDRVTTDMGNINKGFGESHGRSKLKDDDVRQIMELLNQGVFYKDVASKFNVSVRTVGNIARGLSWQHIKREKITRSHGRKSKLNESEVIRILKLVRDDGIPQVKVAGLYGVSAVTIGNIIRGQTWRHLSRN